MVDFTTLHPFDFDRNLFFSCNTFPTSINTGFSINEKAPANTTIGIVSATDPDGSSIPVQYSINYPAINVTPDGQVVFVGTPEDIDAETTPRYAIMFFVFQYQ